MGKVDAFGVAGLDLWFNSNDHLPPHFHAEKRQHWEVTVRFLRDPEKMVNIEWQKRKVSRKKLRRLARLAAKHRGALLAEWERKVKWKTLGEED